MTEFALLALVTDAFGGKGGIAQYNRDLFGALARTGTTSSIVIMPRHAPSGTAASDGIAQLLPRTGRFAYAVAVIRRAVCARVDAVFCGHLFMAPLALLVARLKNAKLVIQMHGIETWRPPTRLTRRAVAAADLVLCVSEHTRAQVLQWAAISPDRILLLPNTVGAGFTPGDGASLRKAWGLEGRRVLLSVGRMSASERYKGHDRVIAAMAQLGSQGENVVYIIAGEGDDLPRLQNLARQAGLADRVRFVGMLGDAQLIEAYRMADLFVMPSTGEGFGIAFLEAMACGTPALGLAVGGAVDALAQKDLGVAVGEEEFEAALMPALNRGKPTNAAAAAADVQARFGHAAFEARAARAIARMKNAA